MKAVLRIYVAEDCPGCLEARELAAWAANEYTQLEVQVIDMKASEAVVPEAVFATPTYMLDDQIVSLGNPSRDEVAQWASVAGR